MKKIIVTFSLVGLLLAGMASAHMDTIMDSQNSSSKIVTPEITTALQDIYTSQKISNSDKIDCSKVSDDQLEELGDAYMGSGITEAQHTAMEDMMGGEGSATLKQAHINMGRAYVGCWTSHSMPMVAMMGNNSPYSANYTNQGNMMGWSSMGSDYHRWFEVVGWITTLLVWILLGSGIITIWKWIKDKK